MQLKVKSIASFTSIEQITSRLSEFGFSLLCINTVISDGKFWHKMLYTKGEEIIYISEEIGHAYLKDPIVTIYGYDKTIDKITEVLF